MKAASQSCEPARWTNVSRLSRRDHSLAAHHSFLLSGSISETLRGGSRISENVPQAIIPSLDIHIKSRTWSTCCLNATLSGPSTIHRQL